MYKIFIIWDTFIREAIARMTSELDANREGTPEVEIIKEVAGNRQRQEAAWYDLNRKRCGGMCGRTIKQILR